MKTGEAHRVPLATQAQDVLCVVRAGARRRLGDGGRLRARRPAGEAAAGHAAVGRLHLATRRSSRLCERLNLEGWSLVSLLRQHRPFRGQGRESGNRPGRPGQHLKRVEKPLGPGRI